MPWPKSSISLSMASASPSILATPSPISRMMPTFCFGGRRFCARDLGFDFLQQVSHGSPHSRGIHSRASRAASLRAHAAVIDVAPDLDAHSADEGGVLLE